MPTVVIRAHQASSRVLVSSAGNGWTGPSSLASVSVQIVLPALRRFVRGRWARMLTHCRRARLLAYRVISLQSAGTVTPGDTAAYRIAVTRLDQESAEVLLSLADLLGADF